VHQYRPTIQKLFAKSVTNKSYQAADIYAMFKWSNHCLHHLLPSEATLDTGVEDILISWFVIILALLGVAMLFTCCMIHCKHLR